MIPGRQMGKSRAVARAVAKNAGLDLEEFDRLWDKYENNIPSKVFKEIDKKRISSI